MKMKRRKLLVEPPTMAAPDIAFILIVFFLVCASVQPETGRKQDIPRSEKSEEPSEQSKNVEVSLSAQSILVDGAIVPSEQLEKKMRQLLAGKESESDRVVIVKSSDETPYQLWIDATTRIEKAGGIITLQLEQEQRVMVN